MKRIAFIGILLLAVSSLALSQNSVYGKNKVQYKDFQWEYIQTNHFDIYYSQNGYELAEFTADAAEDAYESIRKLFRYDINNRIPIVVYNSHNEFQQTNVVDEYLEEGVGGVTELFKNRVVVPFEGNYSQFRHVIHHELVHAVLNDMFYGGSIQSIIASRSPFTLPLWMNEGIAEYASMKWETNSDMFIRDATIQNYLPPIDYLGGYFAYRGGQSVWYYIANKYGEQKISEIMNRMRSTRSVEQGLKSTIGLTLKELSERWQKEQKVIYWPDIAKREEPADFARRLTDHTKDGNFYNTSPAISPQGDKIAFISDRNDYFDVYLMSAIDGQILDKVVSGQRTNDFEELHLLTPGIAWSPDGKKIAFGVKAGASDAIALVDVNSGTMEKLELGLDGVFSVTWSPDGKMLAFEGMKGASSDIYVYEFETKKVTNVTDDVFTDLDPSFSPDSKTIYFSSDRRDFTSRGKIVPGLKMSQIDFSQLDIYSIDVQTRAMKRITDFPNSNETSPVISPDGKKMIYISDRNGINNVYERILATGVDRPITNSLSGIYQLTLSRDGSKLVFASLHQAGFDVFLMRSPLERRLSVTELEPTEFIKRKLELPRTEKPHEIFTAATAKDTVAIRDNILIVQDTITEPPKYQANSKADLKSYVFSPESMRDTIVNVKPTPRFDISNNRDAEGNYVPRKYKLNFTPDLVYGTAGYSTFYGIEGETIFAFSDMLGDHQIVLQTNLLLDLKNSDYGLTYLYLPNRIDYGFQGLHTARFLYLNDQYGNVFLYRFRSWAIGGVASYPIDRFNRLDLSVDWLNLSRDNLDDPTEPSQVRSFIMPSISYVNDNSLWQGGWFAPNNGSRFNATLYGSAKISNEALDVQTLTFDYRSYNKIAKELIFVYRVAGGASYGKDRQQFFIGGTDGWINRRFDQGGQVPIVNVEDYAFLTPVLPVRGYDYNALNGTRFGVANLELRFPLVRYLILGALPVGFQNMLGAAFIDVGSAWSNTREWRAFQPNPDGGTEHKDLLVGTGFGARFFFFGFPLRIDMAWNFNGSGFSQPIWYFSLGPEF
ncbi:MAG TPA: biopolymer transporter Tol [Bacteroidota bacterium]|nr:biopolymer transporter Tol [Bacteroidota bacterium]